MNATRLKTYVMGALDALISAPNGQGVLPGATTTYLRHEIAFSPDNAGSKADPAELMVRLRSGASVDVPNEVEGFRDDLARALAAAIKGVNDFRVSASIAKTGVSEGVHVFIYSDSGVKPEQIQSELRSNRHSIAGRLNTALDQGQMP